MMYNANGNKIKNGINGNNMNNKNNNILILIIIRIFL